MCAECGTTAVKQFQQVITGQKARNAVFAPEVPVIPNI
jgi:hypothetical protein